MDIEKYFDLTVDVSFRFPNDSLANIWSQITILKSNKTMFTVFAEDVKLFMNGP